MNPLYDLPYWSKHYREEALQEVRKQHRFRPENAGDCPIPTGSTFRLGIASVLLAVLVAVLMALADARPAQAAFPDEAFPDGHGPIAFEKNGDIWVASKMHLANLTPNTPDSKEVDPAVSPDGRYVAFSSDRDGDFEIYIANVFTGDVQRVTNNTVDDRKPVWSPDGKWISYQSPHYASPTHSGIFLANVEGFQVSHR